MQVPLTSIKVCKMETLEYSVMTPQRLRAVEEHLVNIVDRAKNHDARVSAILLDRRYPLEAWYLTMDEEFFTDWKPKESGFLDTLPLTLGPRLCAAVRNSGYENPSKKKSPPAILAFGHYCVNVYMDTQQSDRLVPYSVRAEANATNFWITIESPTHLFKYTNGRVEVRSRDGKILMERWDQSAGFIMSGEFHKTFERRIIRTAIKECPATIGAFITWMNDYIEDLIKNITDPNEDRLLEGLCTTGSVRDELANKPIDQEIANLYEEYVELAKTRYTGEQVIDIFGRLEKFAKKRKLIKTGHDDLEDVEV